MMALDLFARGGSSYVFRLVGQRRQAIAQRMEPGDLARITGPHGAQMALLRLEAQANDVHGTSPLPGVPHVSAKAKKGCGVMDNGHDNYVQDGSNPVRLKGSPEHPSYRFPIARRSGQG